MFKSPLVKRRFSDRLLMPRGWKMRERRNRRNGKRQPLAPQSNNGSWYYYRRGEHSRLPNWSGPDRTTIKNRSAKSSPTLGKNWKKQKPVRSEHLLPLIPSDPCPSIPKPALVVV